MTVPRVVSSGKGKEEMMVEIDSTRGVMVGIANNVLFVVERVFFNY